MAKGTATGNGVSRKLVGALASMESVQILDGSGIATAVKATLDDFVRGSTNAAATREVTALLRVACHARAIMLAEQNTHDSPNYV